MCGIAGIQSPRRDIKTNDVKLLMLLNRHRGHDSFGLYYNEKVYKSFGYSNSVNKGDVLEVLQGTPFQKNKGTSVLIHCRQKSVGIVSKGNTHPFIYERDGGRFIFIHNGTLKNHTDLKKEYNIKDEDLVGDTDSEILGYILVHYGWEVLTKYQGAAAFCLYDENNDTMYLWKGFSKHDSTIPSVERPLHIYNNKNYFAFSSLAESLITTYDVPYAKLDQYILEVPNNTLLTVKNGEVIETNVFDRSHINFVSLYSSNYYNHHNGYYNDADWGKGGSGKNNRSGFTKVSNNNNNNTKKEVFTREPAPTYVSNIYYWGGKYCRNGHPVTGKFKINNRGIVYGEHENYTNLTTRFFLKGYMVTEKAFKELIGLDEDMLKAHLKPSLVKDYLDPQHLHILILPHNSEDAYQVGILELDKKAVFEYQPPLSFYKFICENGIIRYEKQADIKEIKIEESLILN